MKRLLIWTVSVTSLGLWMLFLFPARLSKQAAPFALASGSATDSGTFSKAKTERSGESTAQGVLLRVTGKIPGAIQQDGLGEFADFAAWTGAFLSRTQWCDPRCGVALAWKRREALRDMIRTNPEMAILQTVPFKWRVALPPEVARYFETQIDARGELTVALAESDAHAGTTVYRHAHLGGEMFQAFVYGRRLGQSCQTNIPMHGIALDGLLALASEPIRSLSQEEASALEEARGRSAKRSCLLCGQPQTMASQSVAGELGGEVGYFCGVEHFEAVQSHWITTENNAARGKTDAHSGSYDRWTHGTKSLLYMRLNFPDDLTEPISEAGAYQAMDLVNEFYVKSSYNLTAIETIVTPLLTVSQPKSWYGTNNNGVFSLLDEARTLARRAGYDTDGYDLDIACFTSVPTYEWAGLGFVGGKGTWLQSAGWGVTAHELGHNYGLMHANFWDTITNTCPVAAGTNVEYGNIFEIMGSGSGQFNALFKNKLDWLPDTTVHTATTSGVYRIYPFDSPTRLTNRFYAVKVRKDFQRDYWIEFRKQVAANSDSLPYGVLLNWSPWGESSGGSQLIDSTPGTPAGRRDAQVVIGRTFSDFANSVHITPVRVLEATNDACIELQVNVGAFLENRPPELEVQVDRTNALVGELVYFHATASDPDGDALAYAWSFDDETFSTNNLPWTFKQWTSPGEHLVRCVVSDMKGGTRSLNSLVTVGRSTGLHIMGQVVDTNGYPVEGVRVDNNPTNVLQYLGCVTDSDGRYFIAGAARETELFAFKYGFTFTNVTWVNPLIVESNLVRIDFVATPLPSLSVALWTNTVAENDGRPNYFVISRTEDPATNLLVNLTVSGNLTDVQLDPPLAIGTNVIEFLPGSNSVLIAVKPRNDTLIEGAETVTLSITEDPAYALGSLSEATLAIVDDDTAVTPVVSISTTIPLIPENGMDVGQFVISRSGSSEKELRVYYNVLGSATRGVDYTTLPGIALIPAGQSSVLVEFQCLDDKNFEPDEVVSVTLTPDTTYTSGKPSEASVEIVDDDSNVVAIFPSWNAAAEPDVPGRFTVKRDGDLTPNLLITYTVGGSATSGVDYMGLSGSVTIPAGEASADITLTPRDDTLLEGDESVVITLTSGKGYNIGLPASAELSIKDRQKPTVTVTATAGPASEPGEVFGGFEVSRGAVVNGPLTVYLAISGTAIAGADYVPLSSEVTIPNGANKVSLELIAFDDLHIEPTEDVRLFVLPNTNYNVGTSAGATVRILDDDSANVPAAGFVSSSSSAPEGIGPTIMVSLSSTSSSPATVNFRVIGGTAAASDYTLGSTTLTFEAGETAKRIPIQIKDNTTFEADRTIRFALYDPIGATLDGIKIHTFTILDDDAASVSISAPVSKASESGATPGKFRISRSGRTNDALLVNLEVSGDATAPADYPSFGKVVTIPAGAAFVDLPVVPLDDQTVEPDETVVVRLVSAPGATISSPDTAMVVISDNDLERGPIVFVTATNRPCAVEGGANGEFVFWRSSEQGRLLVQFTIGGEAVNGTDCVRLTNVVVFEDGQGSVSLPVVAADDTAIEGEEILRVALTLGEDYRVGHPSAAVVTVQDNDQRVRIDASDFTATEPGLDDAGEFTLTRFGTTNTDLQVFFTITGTAINGVDYATLSNSFTLRAGSLSAVLPIVPIDDPLVEGLETVKVSLVSNAAYVLDTPNNATVTLVDDEPMLTITASVPETTEGSPESGVFTVHRAGNPEYEITARLAFTGTSIYGVDYPPLATNVFFACGVVAIDLQVFPTNDLRIEGLETVQAALLPDPSYTVLSPSNAVVNIQDAGNNQNPLVTITSPSASTVHLLGTNANLILEATVSDDGDTNSLVVSWTKVSGPDSLTFGDTNLPNTTVSFTNIGVYVLRITADDGQLRSFAEVMVVVGGAEMLADKTLYWAFDEGSGTNVLDSSSGGHDGVLVGDPAWVSNAVVGGGIAFSGMGDHVRSTITTNFLDGPREFSLSLWIRPEFVGQDRSILCADESGTNDTLTLTAMGSASCGQRTNVIEATLATTRGSVRRISANNALSNDWQHVVLVWSNGLAPALFINGQLDQPLSKMVPISGLLANCRELIVGKGPIGAPEPWQGELDEVMIFRRALSVGEVLALNVVSNGNYGPIVDAGTNETLQINVPVILGGIVTDDGRPIPPGAVVTVWTNISGPVPIAIPDPAALTNTVEFSVPGEYVFRLTADDGEVKTYDEITLTLIEPTRVDIYASDSEAAELGPDTGQFTFSRVGDINAELTVNFAMSGFTTNGLDYVELPYAVTFSNGVEQVDMLVSPFLDHRTEGDQNLTLTIISNRAYSIGSGEATVVIHDSPFGAWCVERFSLEELTDPTLSGENADFDGDGLVNFAEYAANQDPRSPSTNSPVSVTVETDQTGKQRVTVIYHRRVKPTDTAYALSVSSDLVTWNSGSEFFEELEPVADENGFTETVTARLLAPFPATTNLFLSVRVHLLTTQPAPP